MFGLTRRDVKIAFIFTQVEVATVDIALALAGLGFQNYLAVNIVWEIGFLLEHLISRLRG